MVSLAGQKKICEEMTEGNICNGKQIINSNNGRWNRNKINTEKGKEYK